MVFRMRDDLSHRLALRMFSFTSVSCYCRLFIFLGLRYIQKRGLSDIYDNNIDRSEYGKEFDINIERKCK